jgi:hypothetical protein
MIAKALINSCPSALFEHHEVKLEDLTRGHEVLLEIKATDAS